MEELNRRSSALAFTIVDNERAGQKQRSFRSVGITLTQGFLRRQFDADRVEWNIRGLAGTVSVRKEFGDDAIA